MRCYNEISELRLIIFRSLLLLLISVIIVIFKKRRSLQENLILAILRNLVLIIFKKRAFGVVQVQCPPLDIVLNVEGCVVAFLWLRCKALTAKY